MPRIYLDHISSMPVDPGVLEFAMPYIKDEFGNPSTRNSLGSNARRALEDARYNIAKLINAPSETCIVFTSTSTESNNLAIKGTALRNIKKDKINSVAASVIEHISVINPMKELQKNGFQLNLIPVDSNGIVNVDRLNEVLTKETIVTSIMYANNEIGTVQPIKEISKIVHEKGAYLHVDATVAACYVPIDVQNDGIDLLTISSNDLYGPRGASALYIKPDVKIQTILPGGGQERGLRSGTENIFAIAGMGEAAKIAKTEMPQESSRLKELRDKIIEEILKIEKSYLTGHRTQRLPNHASFRFAHIEGESIVLNMDLRYNIQVSTGSACTSRTLQASHVLLAIGLKHEESHGSMIISLGRSNKSDDVPVIVEAVKETVKRLRDLSPL